MSNSIYTGEHMLNLINRARTTANIFDFELLCLSTVDDVVRALLRNPEIPIHVIAYLVLNGRTDLIREDASKALLVKSVENKIEHAEYIPASWLAVLHQDEEMIHRVQAHLQLI